MGNRRLVTERGMGPRRVVVGDRGSDDLASLIEVQKQALVEKLVAHAAVEGFDVAILRQLAGSDVVPFDRVLLLPGRDGIRGEFSAVVRHNHPRLATRRAPWGGRIRETRRRLT